MINLQSRRFYLWRRIRPYVSKGEGYKLPWYGLLIRLILFPIQGIYYLYFSKFDHYDFESDTFTIYGMKYSAKLFEVWAKNGLPIDSVFKIIQRTPDNLISIEKITEAKINETRH